MLLYSWWNSQHSHWYIYGHRAEVQRHCRRNNVISHGSCRIRIDHTCNCELKFNLPAAKILTFPKLYSVLSKSSADTETNILILSHGTAIILLILYCLYLFFQLRTHANLFDAASQAAGEEEEVPQMSPWAAAAVLVIVTIAVSVCADYLVDSIDSIVEKAHISKTFVGLILLPIVGNAAEHVTAIVVAVKDKMDLAMGVAIGSSMQIALFVTPFLVILGWIMDKPMTLHCETVETVVFFLSVLVVTYVVQDGKSNYLEGCMVSFDRNHNHISILLTFT